MRPDDLGVALLSAFMTLASVALALLGESRPDVYFSMSVLTYFIYTSIDPTLRSRSKLAPIDAALIIAFSAVIALRVIQVLKTP